MKLRSVLLTVAIALILGRSEALADGDKPFQGSYEVAKAQRDGKAADDVIGHRLTIEGDSFEIKADGKTLYKGTLSIDKTAGDVWKIDITHSFGDLKGKKWLGIMRTDADGSVEICDNAIDPSKPRPEAFEAASGSGAILLTFKRK